MPQTELFRTGDAARRPQARPGRADLDNLTGSEIQVWEGSAAAPACRSAFLRGRLEAWQKTCRPHGQAPLLKDLYGYEEESNLESAMILLQQDNDFIYVHQGAVSVREYGRVFRGVQLSTIKGTMTDWFLRIYNATAREMSPRYLQFRIDFSLRHLRWERVVLPVVSDEKYTSKFLILFSEPLDDKIEILQAAFDRSPIGMVAAARPIGDGRQLDEAEILLMNARAKAILKLPPEKQLLPNVSALRRWIQDVRKWDQPHEPSITNGKTIIQYFDETNSKKLTVVVEPIEHFVIFHFID